MKIKKYLTFTFSVLLLLVLVLLKKPLMAFAATDGLLAATSSGTSDVLLIVNELVQVNSIADMDLDNGDGGNTYIPGGGDVSMTNQFCVHYNNAPAVDLTLTSTNGGGGGYILDDGSGNNVPYIVQIDEGDDGSFSVHADGDTVRYTNMADPQVNCAGGLFNAMRVTINDTGSTLGVPNGTYTDMVSFLIAPNP